MLFKFCAARNIICFINIACIISVHNTMLVDILHSRLKTTSTKGTNTIYVELTICFYVTNQL